MGWRIVFICREHPLRPSSLTALGVSALLFWVL